jgi:acyl carrier protein
VIYVDSTFVTLLTPFLKFAGDQELAPASRLRDLGLDSMRAVELLFAIEDEYDIELPDDKLTDATFDTAGSLWLTIDALCSPGGAA